MIWPGDTSYLLTVFLQRTENITMQGICLVRCCSRHFEDIAFTVGNGIADIKGGNQLRWVYSQRPSSTRARPLRWENKRVSYTTCRTKFLRKSFFNLLHSKRPPEHWHHHHSRNKFYATQFFFLIFFYVQRLWKSSIQFRKHFSPSPIGRDYLIRINLFV